MPEQGSSQVQAQASSQLKWPRLPVTPPPQLEQAGPPVKQEQGSSQLKSAPLPAQHEQGSSQLKSARLPVEEQALGCSHLRLAQLTVQKEHATAQLPGGASEGSSQLQGPTKQPSADSGGLLNRALSWLRGVLGSRPAAPAASGQLQGPPVQAQGQGD